MIGKYAKLVRAQEKKLDYIDSILFKKNTFGNNEFCLQKQKNNIVAEIKRIENESGCVKECINFHARICRKCKRK